MLHESFGELTGMDSSNEINEHNFYIPSPGTARLIHAATLKKPVLMKSFHKIISDLSKIAWMFGLIMFGSCQSGLQNGIGAEKLKCEYLTNPLGLDVKTPRFSWIMLSDEENKRQSAYRIVVCINHSKKLNAEEVVWDSEKVSGSHSVNIPYDGIVLKSHTNYYWKVKIWDENERESAWSKPAHFYTGYIEPDKFQAKWIMDRRVSNRSPLFRKAFFISNEREVVSAHIYVTSIGLYQLFLNGDKASDLLFQPSTTQFTEKVLYNVFNVRDKIKSGENVIGLWLGEGQAALTKSDPARFTNANMKEGIFPQPMALLELHIQYSDATKEIILSDESWVSSDSPIVYNNFYGGEDYDARLGDEGWNNPGFDDRHWQGAEIGEYYGKISAQLLPPVTEGNVYLPVKTIKRDEYTYEYDFGKTIGGYWEIELNGLTGCTIIARGSEKCGNAISQMPLSHENNIYWDDDHTGKYYYRDCMSKYTLSGQGIERYKPRFFYHGFRYLQVKISSPDSVEVLSVKAIETNHNLQSSSSFECSDTLLNKIHDITNQTFKNNFIQGVPLSNPNSEKYGWTGDVHLFAEACDYSFNTPAFWTKWLNDFQDAQQWCNRNGMIPLTVPELRRLKPATDLSWLYVYPYLLWKMFNDHRDTTILRNHYETLFAWYKYMLDQTEEYIMGGILGDHMIPGFDHQNSHTTKTITNLINSAYFYRVTVIMSEISKALELIDDHQMYLDIAHKIKLNFNEKFYAHEKAFYEEAIAPPSYTYRITENAIPLQMGLVPDVQEKLVLTNLLNELNSLDYRCFTGILGTKALIDVLQKYNRPDILYKLIKNPSFPGWAYMLELGASTLNQTWDGSGDYNHCMFGSVNQFFYKDLAGIKLQPGLSIGEIEFQPFTPEDINYVHCKMETSYGTIESDWERIPDGIKFTIYIPHNTVGVFKFPVPAKEYDIYLNNDQIVKNNKIFSGQAEILSIKTNNTMKRIQLGSGIYTLKILFKKNE